MGIKTPTIGLMTIPYYIKIYNVSLDPSTYREPLRVLSPLLLTHRIQAKTCFIKKSTKTFSKTPDLNPQAQPPTLNPQPHPPSTTRKKKKNIQVTHVSLTTGSSDRFTSTQNQATTQTLNLSPTPTTAGQAEVGAIFFWKSIKPLR